MSEREPTDGEWLTDEQVRERFPFGGGPPTDEWLTDAEVPPMTILPTVKGPRP